MGIVLLTGNINQAGDSGQFETDASTWGPLFSNTGNILISRSSDAAQAGLKGCRCILDSAGTGWLGGWIALSSDKVIGSLLQIKGWVKIPSTNPVAGDTAVIKFGYVGTDGRFTENTTYQVTKTVAEAKDTWVEISGVFEVAAFGTNLWLDIIIGESGTVNGEFYVDNVRIYEINIEADPEPSVEIDTQNTVVTHETAPDANDGSIDVAVITSNETLPLEYSKDNGATWQSSSQFTGLAPGIYQVKVRDSSDPAAEDSQSFSINDADPAFDFTMDITHESVSGASDGRIEVTVTGGSGPFEYSNDGGQTWQGSNIFTDLAPATYTIAVKEPSTGDIIAHNATINAGEISFDGVYFDRNPIPFERLATSNATKDDYKVFVDVRVEDVAGSSTYTSKMTVAIPPTGGKSEFNLRQAFRGVLTATPPSKSEATLKRLTDRIKLFKVYYGDIYEDLSVPASYTDTLPMLVLAGGLSRFKYPVIDFFTTYLQANKNFMTWAPAEKHIDANQEDYLNFWIYDLAITEINLVIKTYYDDDTNTTTTSKTKSGVEYGQLYQLPAGPVNSGAAAVDPLKNMTRYEIWLTDQLDAVISEARTYIMTEYKHPNTRYLMFLNSLGGYEVFRTRGQSEENTEFEREEIEKFLPVDYDQLDGQYESSMNYKRNRFIYSTGYFTGKFAKQWLYYMQDLLLSRKVFDITDGERVPVVIRASSMRVNKDQDNARALRFEAGEAYSDHSYTPKTITQ